MTDRTASDYVQDALMLGKWIAVTDQTGVVHWFKSAEHVVNRQWIHHRSDSEHSHLRPRAAVKSMVRARMPDLELREHGPEGIADDR